MPSAPPLGPPDWLRALAVGLLNLSGLGLGYALLRRWFALVVCLIATGILLLIALPADPDGVPGAAVVAYVVFLVLAALHGAARGLRRPLIWARSPLALVLGLVLLAAPAGGVVFYDSARDEATQQMLLDRLAAADRLVQTAKTMSFDQGESDYRAALTAYGDLNDNHAGSRAAKLVPDRLKAYYTAIAAPYDKQQYCEAITPLKYLRTVPADFDDKALGSLVTWPDDRLATSYYECGADDLATSASATTQEDYLSELLSTFPQSAQAKKVEPAIRSAIDSAAKALKGSDPCGATDRLGALGSRADSLDGSAAGVADALASDTSRADSYVESGTYTCGLHEYKAGDFDTALTTMNDFIKAYPNNKNRTLAGKIAIAAEVAEELPAAGKKVPTTDSGGSITVTVLNDSPDEVEVLYTGPVTGRFTLAACGSCSSYDSDASASLSACNSSSTNYPQKTLSLPAGTTYFLHKSASGSSDTPGTDTAKLEYGYIYTECAYVVDSLYGF